MATRPTRRFQNMTELEIISSMNEKELADGARRGGIDSILEIGYRLQGAAAANVAPCHDGIRIDADLDIGV